MAVGQASFFDPSDFKNMVEEINKLNRNVYKQIENDSKEGKALFGVTSKSLEEFAETPSLIEGAISNWAQYTIKLERRDEVQSKLKEVGVPTAVYYPKPLNQQNAYMHYPVVSSGVTVSEKLASQVLSLPMHAYMPEKTQQQIIEHVIDAITQ